MIDVDAQIRIAVKTGKVVFGCKQAGEAVKAGKAKLVILASNCPEPHRSGIIHNSRLSKIPACVYAGTSIDLGKACGKPFMVAALTVRDPGDSEILKLAET